MKRNIILIIVSSIIFLGLIITGVIFWKQINNEGICWKFNNGLICSKIDSAEGIKQDFQQRIVSYEDQVKELKQEEMLLQTVVQNSIDYQDDQKNIIYFVENNNDYPLFLNQKLHPIGTEAWSDDFKDVDINKTLSLIPIIESPDKLKILSIEKHNKNSNEIIFLVSNMMLETADDYGQWVQNLWQNDEVRAYKYQVDTKQLDLLFTNSDVDLLQKQLTKVDKISSDGNYISFRVFDCWYCGVPHYDTLIYNIMDQQYKNIDWVYNFEWLSNGDYRYKEYIEIECDRSECTDIWCCSKNPETLPFINKNFSN